LRATGSASSARHTPESAKVSPGRKLLEFCSWQRPNQPQSVLLGIPTDLPSKGSSPGFAAVAFNGFEQTPSEGASNRESS
jgi:hypothetical protein